MNRRASFGLAVGDDDLHISELPELLRRRRGSLLGIAAATALAVGVVQALPDENVRARGRLYLGDVSAPGEDAPDLLDGAIVDDASADGVSAQLALLGSESSITSAILASGLNVRIARIEPDPVTPWGWLRRSDALEAHSPQPLDLGATDAEVTSQAGGRHQYRVQFGDAGEYDVWSGPRRLGSGVLGRPLSLPGVRWTLLPTTAEGPTAGATYRLSITGPATLRASVQERLSIVAQRRAGSTRPGRIVTLEFSDRSPSRSVSFLQQLMRGHLERQQTWKTRDADAKDAFVAAQLEPLRRTMDEAQNALGAYRANHQQIALARDTPRFMERLRDRSGQLAVLQLELGTFGNAAEAGVDSLEAPAQALPFVRDGVLEALERARARSQSELTHLEQRFTPNSPQLRIQNLRVKERERTLDSYVAQRHNRTQLLATHLERIVDQLEKQLASLPEVERTLALLERDVSVYVQLYAELLLRQQRAGILKASTLSKNRIVDWPEPVIKPATGGLRALSAATLAFGLLLGLHWVLWRRLVSSKACSLSLIERGLSGVPIWATIPAGEQSRHGPVPPRPHSEIVEGFRLLGAQLRCAATGAPAEPGSRAKREAVVLVTSPGPADGKTTCALGLATTLARDHRDVLLIDANLLAPSLHRRLGLPLSPGLTDVIAGRLHLEQAVREVCLSVVPQQAAQVDCLCAGVTPDNPAELWSRPELKRLLAEARLLYDFVVLDAPSVPPASDALSLARYADRVLTVVRLGTTSRRLLAAHRAALEECTPPIAAIVNECHPHVRRPPVPLVAPRADLQTS